MYNTYNIPVSWQMSAFVAVDADSFEEAVCIVKNNIRRLPLSDDAEYVSDSYEVSCDEDEYTPSNNAANPQVHILENGHIVKNDISKKG